MISSTSFNIACVLIIFHAVGNINEPGLPELAEAPGIQKRMTLLTIHSPYLTVWNERCDAPARGTVGCRMIWWLKGTLQRSYCDGIDRRNWSQQRVVRKRLADRLLRVMCREGIRCGIDPSREHRRRHVATNSSGRSWFERSRAAARSRG